MVMMGMMCRCAATYRLYPLHSMPTQDFTVEQVIAFVETLQVLRAKTPLSAAACRKMNELYGFDGKGNTEIKTAWLRLCIEAGVCAPCWIGLTTMVYRGRECQAAGQGAAVRPGSDEVPSANLQGTGSDAQRQGVCQAGVCRDGTKLSSHRLQNGCK